MDPEKAELSFEDMKAEFLVMDQEIKEKVIYLYPRLLSIFRFEFDYSVSGVDGSQPEVHLSYCFSMF